MYIIFLFIAVIFSIGFMLYKHNINNSDIEDFVVLDRKQNESDVLDKIKSSHRNDLQNIYTEHTRKSDEERESDLKVALEKHDQEAQSHFKFLDDVGNSLNSVYNVKFNTTGTGTGTGTGTAYVDRLRSGSGKQVVRTSGG